MSKPTSAIARRLALGAANALALAFVASSAGAEGYGGGRYQPVAYTQDGSDEIQVIAPRERYKRSMIGAPIVDAALSKEVSFGDLDLRTSYGARKLESRVRATARNLCKQLDARFPITAEGSPDCYTTAVNDAMVQAHDAIADARQYASNE